MWAFWIACGLAVIGAVLPLLLGVGSSSRMGGGAIPFAVAAVAFAANALIYHQGRPLAAILYFVAGLAIVYGVLAVLAVPLRLAVVGTCPPALASCPSNFERGLSANENAGLSIAVAMGVLAVLTGFFGLLMLYRRRGPATVTHATPTWPQRAPEPATAESTATASPAPATNQAPEAEPAPAPEPMLELEPPEPVLELAAHSPEAAPKPPPRARRKPRAKLHPEPPSTSGDVPPTSPES